VRVEAPDTVSDPPETMMLVKFLAAVTGRVTAPLTISKVLVVTLSFIAWGPTTIIVPLYVGLAVRRAATVRYGSPGPGIILM